MSNEERSAKEIELETKEKAAEEYNKQQTGVGLRKRVGQTRGKNPQIIEWLAFDDSKPETLPKEMVQFSEVTEVSDEPSLVRLLIIGYNQDQYTSASDPLKEFVNPAWSDDVQTQFRIVVRNYSKGANVSLDDAVNLIKPGFEAQFGKTAPATQGVPAPATQEVATPTA